MVGINDCYRNTSVCWGKDKEQEAKRKKQTERAKLLLPPLALPSPSGPPLADPNKEAAGKGETGFAESQPSTKSCMEG